LVVVTVADAIVIAPFSYVFQFRAGYPRAREGATAMPAEQTEKTRFLLAIFYLTRADYRRNYLYHDSASRLFAEKLLDYTRSSTTRENPQIYDSSQFLIAPYPL
jgi:hypothetical protein